MQTIRISIIFFTLVWSACQNTSHQTPPQADAPITETKSEPAPLAITAPPAKSAISGDFNGDGQTETGNFIEVNKGTPEEDQPVIDCELRFSDKSIPSIVDENCFKLEFLNEGDLDGDGADEISIIHTNRYNHDPFCKMTCMRFKNGKWHEILTFDISFNVEKFTPFADRIQRDKDGKVYYYTSELINGHEADYTVDGDVNEDGPDYQDVRKIMPSGL